MDVYHHGLLYTRLSNGPQESYAYSKLPEQGSWIRLLEYRKTSIFPLFERHSPEFRLHVFPLVEAPPYTAVSYMWGDASRSKYITIQDETTCTPLAITASAMECLVVLQQRWRYIWIDSICINQSDNDEKTQQVGIMRDIYSAAAQVVVVLGTSAMGTVHPMLDRHTSEILRRSLQYHVSISKLLLRWYALSDRSGNDDIADERALRFHLRMVSDKRYPSRSSAVRLLCHPYWTRVWIIQEIAVASSVLVYLDGSLRKLDSCFEVADEHRTIANAIEGPSWRARETYHAHIPLGSSRDGPS